MKQIWSERFLFLGVFRSRPSLRYWPLGYLPPVVKELTFAHLYTPIFSFISTLGVRIYEHFANSDYFTDKYENVVREGWKYLLGLCIKYFKITVLSPLELWKKANSKKNIYSTIIKILPHLLNPLVFVCVFSLRILATPRHVISLLHTSGCPLEAVDIF